MRVCDPDGAGLRLWIRWHQTRGADGMACTIALVNLLGERDESAPVQPELRVLLRTLATLATERNFCPKRRWRTCCTKEGSTRPRTFVATWHHRPSDRRPSSRIWVASRPPSAGWTGETNVCPRTCAIPMRNRIFVLSTCPSSTCPHQTWTRPR